MGARATQELGEKLKQARLAQGLTLTELQARTYIRLRYLEAMEQGDFHLIPGEVYVKGFLKLYARELGVDPGPWLAEYEELRKPESPLGAEPEGWRSFRGVAEAPPRGPRLRVHRRPRNLWRAAAMVGLLVAGLALGGVSLRPEGRATGWEGQARHSVPAPTEEEVRSGKGEEGAEPAESESTPAGPVGPNLPPPNWEATWELSPAPQPYSLARPEGDSEGVEED